MAAFSGDFDGSSNSQDDFLMSDGDLDNLCASIPDSALMPPVVELNGAGLSIPPARIVSDGEKGGSLHVCPTCGKSFARRGNLNQHKKIHSSVKSFACHQCDKSFTRNADLNRHLKTHSPTTVNCSHCDMQFTGASNLTAHIRSAHAQSQIKCPDCEQVFTKKYYLTQHIRVSHRAPLKRKVTNDGPRVKRPRPTRRTALGVFSSEFIVPSEENEKCTKMTFSELRPLLEELIMEEMREKRAIKWRIVMKAQLSRQIANGEKEVITSYFGSTCQTEMLEETVRDHLNEAIAKVENCLEEFIQLGSGWVLDKVLNVELLTAKYAPLAGCSYIPLSKKIQAKKAVLNIQNQDEKCFLWCLLGHKMNLGFKDHPERVSKYTPYEADIKMEGIEYPVTISKIPSVEKQNNIRINVFGCEDDEVFPLYVSKREDIEPINLLLIGDEEGQHYCLIRNMSRLLGHLTRHNGVRHYCYRCLHRFSTEELLQNHLQYCKNVGIQRVKLPEQGENILQFENIKYQHPVPYIIYADFESIIVPIHSAQPTSSVSYTERLARHEPCGYSYLIVGPNGEPVKPISVYRGADAAVHFMRKMLEEREEIAEKLNSVIPMALSPQEEEIFRSALACHICHMRMYSDRVRDHDHLTGKFRGAAHSRCNLQYRLRKMIPVVFHNLKNYDAHHIVKTLGDFAGYDYRVIPINMEKYISFTVTDKDEVRGESVSLTFLDSLQFLPASLEKLVANMQSTDFKLLNSTMPRDKVHLLLKKGVYPYEYMGSFERFEETALPSRTGFYSILTEEEISEEAYQHAKAVWEEFGLQTMGDYHDLYVKSDVLQLADIFQNFRKICLQYYEIDPAHLFTAPGLAWQACLRMTQQPLELFTDIDMHLFVERGIRGGISVISKRHAVANNKYMPTYDPLKPSNYILYLDANNLYGWAMSQSLPCGDFKWITPDQVDEGWIASISSSSDVGYILEVDLEYGTELHDGHNLYPLAAEKMTVLEHMLSPTARSILQQVHNHGFTPCEKLVPNLCDKRNYIAYHKNLQLYISLGLKVKKVHRILAFQQKTWLKPYIEFNTNKRKAASNSFEKDFFKLMNNSVYGKTMENLRNHIDIQLVSTESRGIKVAAAPSFKNMKIFSDTLVGVERTRPSILLNRPIYVGFVILELSKILMYDFHYNHMLKKYGEKASLLFTDTDSLLYQVETGDIYEDMKDDLHLYDTSEYPKNHPLYSETNKKRIGCFKDELNGEIVEEFVGLRSKMYSLKTARVEKKTAKGVSRRVVQEKISHSDYRKCLEELQTTREKMVKIGSEGHQLFTLQSNKTTLSPFDDKRFILPDNINTLAYGHYKIGAD